MEMDMVEPVALEAPSETVWLVFSAKMGSRTVWSWAKMGAGPGVDEVYYTAEDGISPADLEEAPAKLGTFLFSVRCPR